MKAAWTAGALLLAATSAGAAGVAGQELARRVAEVEDGWVTFRVEVREGVEVCDRGMRVRRVDGDGRSHWQGDHDAPDRCGAGPMQVEVRLAGGRVAEVRPGPVRALEGARALGDVEPVDASEYLVSLAYTDAASRAAEQGFFLAGLPRGSDPAPGILRAARDGGLPSRVRRSALFWAGQLAADEVTATLGEVAREKEAEQEIRDAAVFALSQHRGVDAVPALMELALDAPHPGTRRTAFFWLSQRDEPAVAEFLADVILGRRGG